MPGEKEDGDIFKLLGVAAKAVMGEENDDDETLSRRKPTAHILCSKCGAKDTLVEARCACNQFEMATCGVPGCFSAEQFFSRLREHADECEVLMEQINAYKEIQRR